MPDGSPIDQWWKSHLPARVTTNPKTATHAVKSEQDGRPYCGYRKPAAVSKSASEITCSTCIANINADIAAGGSR